MEKRPYKILILEDVQSDRELMEHALHKGGIPFESKRVETREDFTEALRSYKPDIIISDYSLPEFDGLSALQITKEVRPDVPFIFVSGVLGDERAVETLREGATDYVLKDNLTRLAPSVQRAFRDVEIATELREKAERLTKLTNSMVGRELKMVELKKNIASLKKQLPTPPPSRE